MPNHNISPAADQASIMTSSNSATMKNSAVSQKEKSTTDSVRTSSVSFVLINPRSQVHPKKFEIKITRRKTQMVKLGRSKEQSDIVLGAKSSIDLLMVGNLLLFAYTRESEGKLRSLLTTSVCRFRVSTL